MSCLFITKKILLLSNLLEFSMAKQDLTLKFELRLSGEIVIDSVAQKDHTRWLVPNEVQVAQQSNVTGGSN